MGGMLAGKAGLTYCHMGTAASRLDPLRDALAAAPGLPRRVLAALPRYHIPCYLILLLPRDALCCVQRVINCHRPAFSARSCLLRCAALRLLGRLTDQRRLHSAHFGKLLNISP